MDEIFLSKVTNVSPIIIEQYERFIPDLDGIPSNDIIGRMNAIIQYLNRIGKINSQMVENWNNVMKWVLDDGLKGEVETRIETLHANGFFTELFQTLETNVNTRLDSLVSNLAEKANQLDVSNSLNLKRDKSVKLELEDMSEETLGAMSGNATFSVESIPQDGSVSRIKADANLTTELNIGVESNLKSVFELQNKAYFHSGKDIFYYNQVFGAIKDITLIGFNPNNQHRLRLIARNNTSFKYRFIICHRAKDGDIWADVFDSGSTFTVTENTNGITTISHTIGSMTVKMKIDYSQIPSGSSNSDGALSSTDGRYRLNSNCFYENKVEKVTSDVSKLKSILNQKMYATKNGKAFKFKYRYDDNQNEVFEFNELGINKIIHPKMIYRETNSQLTSDFNSPTTFYTLTTDWISPYSNVKALTGTLTDFVGTVGGNHGTSGASGFPTARNISANLFVNGVEVTDGEIAECDKAVLIVKNYVSAMNKIDSTTGVKADSFEETVTYTITPNNIEVSVYLTALEDIEIGGYTGLQMTTNMFTGEVYFMDSGAKYAPDGVVRNSLSLPFDNDRMVYADADDVIVTYTNREVGLGNLSAKGSAPIYQLSSFNKLYAHLITSPVTVLTGDSVYYSGGYTFMKPLPCVGAEKAYFIKYNGVTEYCVDFLAVVSNTYLELGVEYLGKQIEIVEKSDGITCDNLISGNGLKISATNFGALKFRIKG